MLRISYVFKKNLPFFSLLLFGGIVLIFFFLVFRSSLYLGILPFVILVANIFFPACHLLFIYFFATRGIYFYVVKFIDLPPSYFWILSHHKGILSHSQVIEQLTDFFSWYFYGFICIFKPWICLNFIFGLWCVYQVLPFSIRLPN